MRRPQSSNEIASGALTERKTGRAAVKQRARRLAAEPLCRHCAAKGRVTLATEVDHIQPLALGGADDDGNCQPLCADCHDAKTRTDFGYRLKPRIGLDGWPAK